MLRPVVPGGYNTESRGLWEICSTEGLRMGARNDTSGGRLGNKAHYPDRPVGRSVWRDIHTHTHTLKIRLSTTPTS